MKARGRLIEINNIGGINNSTRISTGMKSRAGQQNGQPQKSSAIKKNKEVVVADFESALKSALARLDNERGQKLR